MTVQLACVGKSGCTKKDENYLAQQGILRIACAERGIIAPRISMRTSSAHCCTLLRLKFETFKFCIGALRNPPIEKMSEGIAWLLLLSLESLMISSKLKNRIRETSDEKFRQTVLRAVVKYITTLPRRLALVHSPNCLSTLSSLKPRSTVTELKSIASLWLKPAC